MEEQNDYDYEVKLRIEDVRLLYHCVQKRIETWEGSPARPWGEQEHLWYLRVSLFRMILDYKYNNM